MRFNIFRSSRGGTRTRDPGIMSPVPPLAGQALTRGHAAPSGAARQGLEGDLRPLVLPRRGFLASILGLIAARLLPNPAPVSGAPPIVVIPQRNWKALPPPEIRIYFSGPAIFDPEVQRTIVEAQRMAAARCSHRCT